MGKLQLLGDQIHYEGDPIDNYFLERVIAKRFPEVSINFIEDDDSIVYIRHNNKTVTVKHLVYLREGEFSTIESWEKEVERTLFYIKSKLYPSTQLMRQEKETDLV
jgi:hypothetical protein